MSAVRALLTVDVLLPFAAFWSLVALTVASREARARLVAKPLDAWILDVTGLCVQGALVPLAELTLVVALLDVTAPSLKGALALPWWQAALLNLVVVDYLYYWNHRALHTRALWPIHAVHHSVTDMDVLATSRNPVWASFLIVYVWVNGALAYVLMDARPFVVAASVTAALDLWRHSRFGPRRGSALHRVLSFVVVTPSDHAWHHARATDGGAHGNYGANFALWDRLHGTWIARDEEPAALGDAVALPLWKRLLWPFGA